MSRLVTLGSIALVGLLVPFASADSSPQSGRDRTEPGSPGPILVKGATQTSVTIAWLPATDDVAVTAYGVLWNSRRPRDTELTVPPWFTKTGLACGTSYQVSVRALDAGGNASTHPSEAIVSTGACLDASPPSVPTGVTQIAQTESSATLTWTASSDDVGVAGYVVSRGGVPLGVASNTSYTVDGLTCGSGYTAVVQAYDAAGNRSESASFTGRTASCTDTTPPTAPAGLTQHDATQTSMALSWSPSRDASGIKVYGVYLDGAPVANASTTSTRISGLACGKTHTVGVDAVDNAGNRSQRTSAAMPTAACPSGGGGGDATPPSMPGHLGVTSTSVGSVSLRWDPSTDNVGVWGYSVYRGSTSAGDTPGTTFTFASLPCGSTVLLGVEARDLAGNRSPRAAVSASTQPCGTTTPPAPPGPPTLQSRTETSISVSWAPSPDTSRVTGYGVYRAGVRQATVGATQYTFTGLACGTTYTLGVDAVDGSGSRSTPSTTMLTTAACLDILPPTKPTGVTASDVTSTTLKLSWQASTDEVGVRGYDVYVDNVLTATTTGLQVALGGLKCGAVLALAVEAFDPSGNRSARATTTATTALCGSPLTGATIFVSPSGSDGNPCTAAAPCSSLDRAYQLAQPGNTVVVGAGSYGPQAIAWRASMDGRSCDPLGEWGAPNVAECITFDLTSPGIVFGNLDIGASGIHLRGLASGGIPGPARTYSAKVKGEIYVQTDDPGKSPDHVTVTGLDANALGIYDADHVLYKDLDAGARSTVGGCGYVDPDTGESLPGIDESKIGSRLGVIPSNVVLDGIYFHDVNQTPAGAADECHDGALFFINGDGVTLRNSVWSQNWVYDIQVQAFNGRGMPTNVLVENNWFGCGVETYSNTPNAPNVCNGQSAIQFDGSVSNWLIRYNTAGPGTSLLGCYAAPCNYSNVRAVGNLGSRSWSCASGISFGYNAFTEGPCGSTDVQWSGSLASGVPGAENFALANAGTAANLVAGSGADYDLSTDIFGRGRSVPREAGATELG